ncbi:MAG: hypothetical protein CO103_03870 [Chloroflexi bacterium CG_4_9_14_3_um_filter_45_9]|nr:MAG: hypothetical protein AUK00_04420 [Dehalococcoidia bacterium CG2_30_46_9]PIU23858.1 MAG: hypothetical protein COT13_00790 [Chloroflexi bacterium CG08_land_8_20_14_0_20_45_12]PIX27084.1 MAG: hypothetical protein COZ67_04190 [Chloroflexi bacterium CG_4_8_14_3_um_filter_45_15]PJB49887.1 MAG: hypothetical protein CO103_03870 [Chloroflexi bacterium CG_4_9_14_3_um_filter_45_9]
MERIVLIQSDMALSRELTFFLQHSGFQVASASEGRQALLEINRTQPDAIVMAEDMAKLNGDELCILIRQTPQAPVIILGTKPEESGGVPFLECGASAYVPSPLQRGLLLARIRSLLRRKGAQGI